MTSSGEDEDATQLVLTDEDAHQNGKLQEQILVTNAW
jgi:hypothetical protein